MPYGEAHRTQKRKNYALMLVLLVLMVLFFAITVVRVGGAAA
jgi:hypothetical protein